MRRWLVWGGILLVWTAALEAPGPTPVHVPGGEFIVTNRYYIAKTVHVLMYAFLTVLGAWLPMPARFRRTFVLLLIAHAGATEVLQLILEPYCHRGGSLEDVVYDQIGMFVGLLMAWKWWTQPSLPDSCGIKPGIGEAPAEP